MDRFLLASISTEMRQSRYSVRDFTVDYVRGNIAANKQQNWLGLYILCVCVWQVEDPQWYNMVLFVSYHYHHSRAYELPRLSAIDIFVRRRSITRAKTAVSGKWQRQFREEHSCRPFWNRKQQRIYGKTKVWILLCLSVRSVGRWICSICIRHIFIWSTNLCTEKKKKRPSKIKQRVRMRISWLRGQLWKLQWR